MSELSHNKIEIIQKLGEDTIYSAKGHFKACDIRRSCMNITIWTCVIVNIVGLIFSNPVLCKIMSSISLFGMIALLIWDSGENKDYRSKHKRAAENYLALHKEIRDIYYSDDITQQDISALSNRVIELNQSCELEIPSFARKRAKKAIENKEDSEVDKWYVKKD